MDDLASGASNAPTSEPVSAPETGAAAPSTREALERAFASVDTGGDTGAEAPAVVDKPASERARDESGRFAKADRPADAPAKTPAAAQDGEQPAAAPEAAATVAAPPQRFAKAAQEAWAQAPEAVRAEVVRMEAELTKGLNEYRQRFEPIKQFDEMARAGGTTLDKALSAYVGMENLIRRDPVQGMLAICQNAGLDPVKVAQALVGRTGGQPAQAGEGGEADPRDAHIAELRREIQRLGGAVNSVGQTVAQQRQQEAMRQVTSEVESFAKDHPRFDELADDIAEMLSTRYAKDLHDAYVKADRLRPAAAAASAPPAPQRAQTPKAALSITGSPAGGSNPASRKPAGSAREALNNAFAQVGLG